MLHTGNKLTGENFMSSGAGKSSGVFFVAGCLFGLTPSFAIDVPSDDKGTNLSTYINSATGASAVFNLTEDVTLESTFNMNGDRPLSVTITGNGHTINRTSQSNVFQVNRPGANLTITNATITSTDLTGTNHGAIVVNGGNANVILNLDGTTFSGNRADGGHHGGGIGTFSAGTVVNGAVRFIGNYADGYSGGGVSVNGNGSSLTFNGIVDFSNNTASNRAAAASLDPDAALTFKNLVSFTNNSTVIRGGAIWLDRRSIATFEQKATFTGNHTKEFGGAINLEFASAGVVFENDATFTNNYVQGSTSNGARGGAISIGTGSGKTSGGQIPAPQLQIGGRGEFIGNYVWDEDTQSSYGGAIAMTANDSDPTTNNGNFNDDHIYRIAISEGIFTDNYAYSVAADSGYGGAIFSRSLDAEISLGSGSEFTGNAATGLGGAIYFNIGTINLDGNVTFEGNRQNATFASVATSVENPKLRPVLNALSGSANAIYFGGGNNNLGTATLNMTTRTGETINFNDPIESADGKTVIVTHSGDGNVVFRGYNSDVLAQTDIDGGSFILVDGAQYGRVGLAVGPNGEGGSSFNLRANSTLQGDDGSTLRANEFTLAGRIEATEGTFFFEGGDIDLFSTSVLAINIFVDENNLITNSKIDAGGNAININGAKLAIDARNYVPSQDYSDTFTIVANLSEEPVTFFDLEGQEHIMINGAEFKVLYNSDSIVLQQMTVPEPSTYALLLAIGCVGGALIRRQRRNRKVSLS